MSQYKAQPSVGFVVGPEKQDDEAGSVCVSSVRSAKSAEEPYSIGFRCLERAVILGERMYWAGFHVPNTDRPFL